MKKVIVYNLVILFVLTVICGIVRAEIPSNFTVSEDLSLFQPTFEVESNGSHIGTIKKEIFSLHRTFNYTGDDGQTLKAVQTIFSWGFESTITDNKGNIVGVVKEAIFSGWPYNEYTVTDSKGYIVMTTQQEFKWNPFAGITIDLYNKKNGYVGSLFRKAFTWLDVWEVKSNGVDPRLILFVATFKTDSDNSKH